MRVRPAWVLCLLCVACAADPIDNPGTWKPAGPGLTNNDQNLRAMVVNPGDLARGSGDPTSLSVNGALAARRELTGRRAPLPFANASSAGQGANSLSGGGGLGMQPQTGGTGPAGSAVSAGVE